MNSLHGRYIDPMIDVAFKRIFGEGGDKGLLIHLLNQVLRGRKVITDLVYNQNEHPGETEELGGATFDLLCTGEQGERFLVEVQRCRQRYFKERTLFYASKLICEQVPRGNRQGWNYQLKEVYVISLLEDFTVSELGNEGHLHDICLCNRDTHEIFYDKLGFTYIELVKFVKTEEELESNLDWWLYLLKHLSRMNQIPALLPSSIFNNLFHIAEYSKLNKEEQKMYDSSLKARWDNKNAMDYAIEQGIEKGIEQGIEKGRAEGEHKKAVEIAREMKKGGVPLPNIAQYTRLNIEEIEQL